jgi:hypothetical protein
MNRSKKEKMKKEDHQIYNDRVMLQEEKSSYKEVEEYEERHDIERQGVNKEILINRKPSEHQLDPVAEDHNMGQSVINAEKRATHAPV